MAALSIIGIAICLVLLMSMVITAGTQDSISQLAKQWRWLLLIALWSQVLILPQMLDMTPQNWEWMPFLGIFAISICGGASLFKKEDNLTHMIAAAIAFVCLAGWVMCINSKFLMPLVVCAFCGKEKIIWRVETGLIASVYTTLLILG